MRELGTFRGHKVSCEGQLKSMGCLLDSVSIRGERSDIPGLSKGGMKGQTFLACLQRHTGRRGLHSPKPWISGTTVFLSCVPRYHLCGHSGAREEGGARMRSEGFFQTALHQGPGGSCTVYILVWQKPSGISVRTRHNVQSLVILGTPPHPDAVGLE